PGCVMMGPPGCASGRVGVSNRKRSRPGRSLDGTICAAAVANETQTIAQATAMARTPANMTLDPQIARNSRFSSATDDPFCDFLSRDFRSSRTAEAIGSAPLNGPVLAIFADVSIRPQ